MGGRENHTSTTSVNIEEQPRNTHFVNTECVTCPFCKLRSKNLDELKTHFDNEIQSESSDVCFNCSKCNFNGNKSELDKHFKSKHSRKYVCEECGNTFMDPKTFKLHVQSKHEETPPIEPFPCEKCGLVLAIFYLLQEHVKEHTPVTMHCQHCDFSAEDQESLQSHMFESHEGIAILCNTAKQVDKLSDSFASFEHFKSEISNVLKSLFDNQHILKQEMFLIRNNQPKPQTRSSVPEPELDQTEKAAKSPGDNGISSLPPAPPAGPPVAPQEVLHLRPPVDHGLHPQ